MKRLLWLFCLFPVFSYAQVTSVITSTADRVGVVNATVSAYVSSFTVVNSTTLSVTVNWQWTTGASGNAALDRPKVVLTNSAGGNAIIVDEGGGTPANGTYSTTRTISGTVAGLTYTLNTSVWKSFTGNSFADPKSTTFTASTAPYKVDLKFDNRDGISARTFSVWQSGSVVATVIVPAGQLLMRTVNVPDNTTVSVTYSSPFSTTNGVWTSDGAPRDIGVGTYTPVAVTATTNYVSVLPPPQQNKAQDNVNTNNTGVWNTVTVANFNAGVTAGQNAEGVGKIEAKLDELIAPQKAARKQSDDVTSSAMQSSASSASSAEATQIGGVMKPSSTLSTSPGSPTMAIALPRQNLSIDFSSVVDFDSFKLWLKAAIAWAVYILLMMYMYREFHGVYISGNLLQQAKGNAVFGGTGGQATAFIAAGLITIALLALPTAFAAYTNTNVTVVSNPLDIAGSYGAGVGIGIKWFYDFIPVATLMTAMGTWFSFKQWGWLAFSGASAAVRFIVP